MENAHYSVHVSSKLLQFPICSAIIVSQKKIAGAYLLALTFYRIGGTCPRVRNQIAIVYLLFSEGKRAATFDLILNKS